MLAASPSVEGLTREGSPRTNSRLLFLRRYGIRSTVRRLLAARTSPLFGITAAQVGLAHVTRVDRSSSRLVVHGRGPTDAAR